MQLNQLIYVGIKGDFFRRHGTYITDIINKKYLLDEKQSLKKLISLILFVPRNHHIIYYFVNYKKKTCL